MTVRVYRSTDVGAPVLNASLGSLITVLDACLVTGYGSVVAAGWTKEYSGTNKAAYKQGTGSNGFYLRVDHLHANYARVVGYENMTGIDTGTNPFPTNVQASGGYFWFTSTITAVPWTIVATERFFYFASQYSNSNLAGHLYAFGDFETFVSPDIYNTLIVGGNSTNAIVSNGSMNAMSATLTTTVQNVRCARDYTQTILSPDMSRFVNPIVAFNSTLGGRYLLHDYRTGNLELMEIYIGEVSGVVRGKFPGLLVYPVSSPYGTQVSRWFEVSGTGTETGKTFIAAYCGDNLFLIETTDNW